MDDHLRGWMWAHPDDNKYCEALSMEHRVTDTGEQYVDSLRQLNKIVERILPDKSPLSLMSVPPKFDLPMTARRSYMEHGDIARDLARRKSSSLSSNIGEIQIDSPVKHPSLSTISTVCVEDSLRLKALRPSDSLNDSAYETYCGDASNDAADSVDKTGRTDELSSGNDPTDYCGSPLGVKSENNTKPGYYSKEMEGEIVGRDRISACHFSEDVNLEKARCKSTESAVSMGNEPEPIDGCVAIKRDLDSGDFCTESDSKHSSLMDNSRLMCGTYEINNYRVSLLDSSELSSANKLLELGRYSGDDKCGTSASPSVHVSVPLPTARLGSSWSRDGSISRGNPKTNDDGPCGRKSGTLPTVSTTIAGGEEVKSFTCPHCSYSATKKGQVRKHLSVHGIFLCAHCEFGCDRADLLEEHRRERHPGLCGRRLCKKCRVLFQSSELEAHERQCSGEKQRWACHTCGKEFKFLSVMKAHAHKWHPAVDEGGTGKLVDSASDTASSKTCSISSGTPTITLNITQPEPISGAETKQFQCPECGKVFKTRWTLSNHSLLHAGGDTPFCCDVDSCSGVTFRSDKELNCHRMAVHRLGPTKYECTHPGCTMQFAKYGHFKRHQLTHTVSAESGLLPSDATDRKFVCDWAQCGKAFSHPDNLRIHYRRHTDEKPYHCHQCEAAYRQKSGLKYHLDKVHGEKSVGRSGRKRKLTTESGSALVSTGSQQIPSKSAFVSSLQSSTGDFHSPVDSRNGQTVLSDRDIDGSKTVSLKHTAFSQLTVRDVSVTVSDLQKRQWPNSDTSDTAKSRRWSLQRSLSHDSPDNLENIDINDDWLLDENDGFLSGPLKQSEPGVQSVEEVDRDLAGSTSDTEPLDEDICEELRKLSDAISSEVLSPRGLDSISSPFGSPIGTTFGVVKSDHVGDIVPDVPSLHPAQYRGADNHKEQIGVYDQFTSSSPLRGNNLTSEFYPCDSEVTVTTISTNIPSAHGQCNVATGVQNDVVNGYLPDGFSCHNLQSTHFDSRNSSTSEAEITESLPYHPASFESPGHPWSASVNSRWSGDSVDAPAFMPVHSVSSLPASSSADTGFGNQICRMYSNLVPTWSPLESGQRWHADGDIIPNWVQRRFAKTAQPDLPGHLGYGSDWRMGRQGESAFSRSGTMCDSHLGFNVGLQASPRPSVQYQSEMMEAPLLTDRFVDSFAGKHPSDGIGQMGSWPHLYGRTSHMTGLGSYEYCLPRNVYRQSDHFYLTSGYSGIQSDANCERTVDSDGSYGIANSCYPMQFSHAPSWSMPNSGETLQPDTQASSVLYSIVPRYY